MSYKAEIDALQRWLKSSAGLNSVRLKEAQTVVARPVILWETPNVVPGRRIDSYSYLKSVSQYGKLYVKSLDQLLEIQEAITVYLDESQNILPVYGSDGAQVGHLKNVTIELKESETLDVPITVKYEAAYGRTRPADPGPAASVTIKEEPIFDE